MGQYVCILVNGCIWIESVCWRICVYFYPKMYLMAMTKCVLFSHFALFFPPHLKTHTKRDAHTRPCTYTKIYLYNVKQKQQIVIKYYFINNWQQLKAATRNPYQRSSITQPWTLCHTKVAGAYEGPSLHCIYSLSTSMVRTCIGKLKAIQINE